MIEQPRKQTPRDRGDWFYSICSCGMLLAVTDGVVPEHEYTYLTGGFGFPFVARRYRCDRSLTLHSTHQ